jgi:lipopolysaccharide transport system permease protein
MVIVRRPYRPSWRDLCRPLAPWQSLWLYRRLIFKLALREVRSRYQGSLLGPAWPFLTPTLAIIVYTFVFNTLLRPRWGSDLAHSGWEFALLVMLGLFLFNAFSEMVGRCPHLLLSQPHFVRKLAFPLEVFSAAALLAAAVHLVIGLSIIVLVWSAMHGGVPLTLWLLPVHLISYLLLLLGLAWFLAAAGAFLRDLAPTLSAAAQLLLFLTPVFYPATAIPPDYRHWLLLNPLAIVVEGARGALVARGEISMPHLAYLALTGLASSYFGYLAFTWMKPRLADVV